MASQEDLKKALAANDVTVKPEQLIEEDVLRVPYLGVGVHEVTVDGVELVQASTGTLGMLVKVSNDEGIASDRLWLSERALPYSIMTVQSLLVHNAKDEVEKEKIRNGMKNVLSAKMLFEVSEVKLPGVKCWAEVYVDGTYMSDSEEKPSYKTRLLWYKKKQSGTSTSTSSVKALVGGGESIDTSTVPF